MTLGVTHLLIPKLFSKLRGSSNERHINIGIATKAEPFVMRKPFVITHINLSESTAQLGALLLDEAKKHFSWITWQSECLALKILAPKGQ